MPIASKHGPPQFENDAERSCFNFFINDFLPNLVTADEIAKRIDVTRGVVVKWQRKRGLQSFKIGGGRVFYVPSVATWARKNRLQRYADILERTVVKGAR